MTDRLSYVPDDLPDTEDQYLAEVARVKQMSTAELHSYLQPLEDRIVALRRWVGGVSADDPAIDRYVYAENLRDMIRGILDDRFNG